MQCLLDRDVNMCPYFDKIAKCSSKLNCPYKKMEETTVKERGYVREERWYEKLRRERKKTLRNKRRKNMEALFWIGIIIAAIVIIKKPGSDAHNRMPPPGMCTDYRKMSADLRTHSKREVDKRFVDGYYDTPADSNGIPKQQ